MGQPEISVVIPVYNRADAVERTLLSLGEQTLSPQRFEVVVVDDGSTDGSAGVVTGIQPGLPYRSRLIRHKQGGPAAARNRGAEAGQGDLLLFWDSDMIAGRDTLQIHVDLHLGQTSILVAGGRRPWEPACRSVFARTLYLREGQAPRPHFRRRIFQEASSSNLSLGARDFWSLGGFDEGLRAFEDVDLAYRAEGAGLRLVFSEEAFGYHNHPMTLEQDCSQQRRYQEQAVLFLHKHPELLGQIEHLADKGPIDWRWDAAWLVARKMGRWAVARPQVLRLLKQVIAILEKRYPSPAALRFLYTKVISSYLWLGYREGIHRYGLPQGTSRGADAGHGSAKKASDPGSGA